MRVIDVVQGSEAWLSLRKNKITATDTSKILGINPWCSAYSLWEEKLGLRETQVLNDKMREGMLLEEKARDCLNKHMCSDFKPTVLESGENSFQIASLDGVNSTGNILEIKCGVSSHEMAKRMEIPTYYYSQVQKQMWCSENDWAYYMSYRSEDDWTYWTVNRDDKFIKEMNEKEKIFYDCLMNLIPPEMTDKDYIIREDFEWDIHAKEYKYAKQQKEYFEKEEKRHKESLIQLCNGKSTKGCGVIISKIIRKGNIDYNSIEELRSLDLEKYRKEPTIYMSARNG